MSWLEEIYEDFKKLPTWGKVLVLLSFLLVGWLGYLSYVRRKQSALQQSGLTINPGSGDSGGSVSPPTLSGGPTPPPGGSGNPPPPPPKPKPPPPPPKLDSYIVQSGDSLSLIAAKLRLRGGWQALYQQNKQMIDAEARRRGVRPGPRGYADWIFPGQRLRLR